MADRRQHSYEEIRTVIVDILSQREPVEQEPTQWTSLIAGVEEVFARRQDLHTPLHPGDTELVRDVFWDLFRQGVITLGFNEYNPMWPWFRLSNFGQRALQGQTVYRFHDTASYLGMLRTAVPDITPEVTAYVEEAVGTFYADCLFASCVMLGVAAEAEFLRLIQVASENKEHGAKFTPALNAKFISQKITKFQAALNPLKSTLPKEATENVDTNLSMVQGVIRMARNDAGHPAASSPQREQVYIFLQLFIPLALQLMRLRNALT
jgi:hypothetical protein